MVIRTSNIKSSRVLSDEGMNEIFARIFSRHIKELGRPEAMVSEFAIFWCIAWREGNNQASISKLAGVSQKTVSRVISNLGDIDGGLGWIEQRVYSKDRRVRLLYLTKKGQKIRLGMVHALAKLRDQIIAKEGGVIE